MHLKAALMVCFRIAGVQDPLALDGGGRKRRLGSEDDQSQRSGKWPLATASGRGESACFCHRGAEPSMQATLEQCRTLSNRPSSSEPHAPRAIVPASVSTIAPKFVQPTGC
jgi:hypothetical protein